ncbi:hypothetical protein FOA52_004680 [Chlamydomonas sp. UWO 241]|nr:hypothetical protein FOA52_004680 [Chlamydomonas sp. UWO 241]
MKTALLIACALLVESGAGADRRGLRLMQDTTMMPADPMMDPAMMPADTMTPADAGAEPEPPATEITSELSDPMVWYAGAESGAEDRAKMAAWYDFLKTTGGTYAALLFADATGNVTDAAPPCFADGLYHLSCYSANLSLTDIGKAKQECLAAFEAANPDCITSIDLLGQYAYGCGKFVVYHLPTLECHQSYQKEWEKTNPACTFYTLSGLGDKANRAESVAAMTDYACAMPTAPA